MLDDETRRGWLRWRRGGVGGSDVAGILGISPWATPWSVYASKVGEVDDDPSEAMEFGHRAEPMLAEWFHDRTGLYVIEQQTLCTHPMASHRRCTPDGFVAESPDADLESALGVAEWKTTSDPPKKWAEQVPDHYAAQAAWTLHVTQMPVVWFGVLHMAYGRPQFRIYEFRDRTDEEFIVEAVDEFWFQHVMLGVPPAEVDGSEATRNALNHLWRNPEGTLVADEQASFLFDQVLYFKAERDSAIAELKVAEAQLKAVLADHERLDGLDVFDGVVTKLATWKWEVRRPFDVDSFRKAYPDLAREFTKETSTRVLRTFKTKEDHGTS